MNDILIKQFRDYHALKNKQPLIGKLPGGWESFSKYLSDATLDIPETELMPDDLRPEKFADIYRAYVKSFTFDDDLMRCIEPINSFPWTELAAGCGAIFKSGNFWARPVCNEDEPDFDELLKLASDSRERWLNLYEEHLVYLAKNYGDSLPIGQSILRGPLDMLAAIMGEQKMVYAFYDYPDEIKTLLMVYAELFVEFLKIMRKHYKPFMGGGVIGQYYIWGEGLGSRLQNDAMSLLSPEIYESCVLPCDRHFAAADINLYHIHSSAFHLLELILALDNIQIIQISKDEGVEDISSMMFGLARIQAAGKQLVLKGRLGNEADLTLIRDNLKSAGLCLQFVCDSEQEAEQSVALMRSILK